MFKGDRPGWGEFGINVTLVMKERIFNLKKLILLPQIYGKLSYRRIRLVLCLIKIVL